MNRIINSLFAACLLCGCAQYNADPVSNVDPFIGTGAHGHTYPGATTPFGMVQLSPDTRLSGWDACAGYHYDDNVIYGFSHTHLSGTGCADLADVLFHPSASMSDFSEELDYAPYDFSHDNEEASCGYYAVKLPEAGLRVELSATPRTGLHRYTFSSGDERLLLIDLSHTITEEKIDMSEFHQSAADEICGMRRTQGWVGDQYVYFSAKFSAPFEVVKNVENRRILLSFAHDIENLTVAVGLSSVNCENARENREVEVPALDFDAVKAQTRALWQEALDDIVVEGGDESSRVIFYTAQYHSKLAPNVMNDVNGEYRRNDGSVAVVPEGRKYYSTLSLWDTFRTWNPLQTLVDTTLVADMVWSMMDMYEVDGELPMWPLYSGDTHCMIGYHAVSVMSDAYQKGIVPCNPEKMLEAMIKTSNAERNSAGLLSKMGYIPSNVKNQSVSSLLEFAYDDWAIARMAERMGREEIAREYYDRSERYANVFDGSTCFFRGHLSDGSWTTPFEEFSTGRDFTEATPWQYRFFVPHDILGLESLFGGRLNFIRELDRLFTLESDDMDLDVADVTGLMGQYAHGNEPSHHMAYLNNWTGEPWKTQELTRRLLDEMYEPTPGGIIGNEDCGQMSAWYVMSAMGFYPVCPASGEFAITTPLFDAVTIRLANGNVLKINAENPSHNCYISSVTFNGETVNRLYMNYVELMKGGCVDFALSSVPDKSFAATPDACPYSLSAGNRVSTPYVTEELGFFTEPVSVHLHSATEDAELRYTLDGEEPTRESPLYSEPVVVDRKLTLKCKAFKEGYEPSRTFCIKASPAEFLPAVASAAQNNGVRYIYYIGNCSSVADIASCKQVRKGVMPKVSIADADDADHFAYVFEGLIDVPEKDVWEFSVKSDDGSKLFIDGVEVVSNDYSHAAIAATGRVALEKGLHRYRLLYFEDYEGEHLSWHWRRRGGEFREIDEEFLKY